MSDCMCEFENSCGGMGYLQCSGCGGDQCVCVCGGEMECPGCDECSDDDGEDDYYDGGDDSEDDYDPGSDDGEDAGEDGKP